MTAQVNASIALGQISMNYYLSWLGRGARVARGQQDAST